MMRPTRCLVIALALIFSGPLLAQGDTLEQELSILADRFFLRFPKEAKNEARSVDIMSAPPGEEEETRITLDHGEERMVLFAQELSAKGGKDLAQDWKNALKNERGMQEEVTELRADPLVLHFVPQNVTPEGQAIFIGGIVVRCADGMLVNAQAFINPKAYERLEHYKALADRIFRSVRSGTRVLDLSARTVTLDEFSIDLPADHIVTSDGAYDFKVYRVRRVALFGSAGDASITIYFGHHPSLFSRELEVAGGPEHVPGTLFGKAMEWLRVVDKERPTYLMEQILPLAEHGQEVVHVAIVGNDMTQVEAMLAIAQGMRLK